MANNIVNILRTGIEKDCSQKQINVNRNLNISVGHVKILSSLANYGRGKWLQSAKRWL